MRSTSRIALAIAAFTTLALADRSTQHVVPGTDFSIPRKNAPFDYVVVGGGTARLAVAYRLAEDGTNSVAVIEVGGFYD